MCSSVWLAERFSVRMVCICDLFLRRISCEVVKSCLSCASRQCSKVMVSLVFSIKEGRVFCVWSMFMISLGDELSS